mgnify:CR=1 FL=1
MASFFSVLASSFSALALAATSASIARLSSVISSTIIGVTFYRHPELLRLRRKEKQDTDYTVEEDTIYGIRFDEAIAEARSRKDYREVVRLTYLKTLRACPY